MIAPKVDANTGEPGPRINSHRAAVSAPSTWPPKNIPAPPSKPRTAIALPSKTKGGKKWTRIDPDTFFDRLRDQVRGER